ncbi:MAG: transglycosylase domain-containing protein [Clostridia bacterium]|nr:transglycosylase domain-containing protein [Clostridia bacterium]
MSAKHNKAKKIFLVISMFVCILFVSFAVFVTVVYNKYDLDIEKLTSTNNGIMVYSASGIDNTLYNTNRSIVEIETLPNYVTQAFVDIEDKRFYDHNGYDIKRIAKASLVNLTTKSKSQGASTISQQLIKNALLNNKKTYTRKIKEVVLAIKLEKKFSKQEILEMYLNTIYFGSNAYGIENASQTYFNKSAKDLTLNEACCLAGIIKSPAKFSPKLNYQNSINRKNLVAASMLEAKSITQQQYNEILSSPIILNSNNNVDHSYEEEAIYEACKLLNLTERELINKNYSIVTHKDDDLQMEVIKANNEVLESNKNNTNSNLDSLSVVVDNNGCVKAYYANSNYNLHNLTRQTASTLKPFAVYLPCLSHNILTPATTILDEEINYNGFEPNNADNKYHGYVSTRQAISESLNIPAVKALDYVGLQKAYKVLQDFDINIANADLNLSLALGATKNGVKVMEMLQAYSTLANMGVYKPISFIDKILDSNGKIVYKHEDYIETVFDSKDCYLMTDMLKDTAKTGTAKRFNDLNLPIASKTGTATNNNGQNTDLYNIAYSSQHTLLTWIADIKTNHLPSSLHSSVQPTIINKDILSYLYKNVTLPDFDIPTGIQKMPYDILELENNHRIVSPTTNIQRYIAYDYFKTDYPPEVIIPYDITNLKVTIDKFGANICFDAQKNINYKLCKITNGTKKILLDIKEKQETLSLIDNDIFGFENIEYYIEDIDGNIISNCVNIRPKDYLVDLLNNQILKGKKKWYV